MSNILNKKLIINALIALNIQCVNSEPISNAKLLQILKKTISESDDKNKEEITKLQNEIQALKNNSTDNKINQEYEDKIKQLQDKNNELQKQIEENQNKTNDLNSHEKKALEDKIKLLEEEKYKQNLNEQNMQVYEDNIRKLNNERERLEKEREELQKNMNNSNEQQKKELEDKMKAIEERNKALIDQINTIQLNKTNNNTNTNIPTQPHNSTTVIQSSNLLDSSLICAEQDLNKSKERYNNQKLEQLKIMHSQTVSQLDTTKSYYRQYVQQICENNEKNNIKAFNTVDNNKSKNRVNNIWYKIKLSNNNTSIRNQ